ncbi:MAG: AAA family ATPase [Campylobacterales bacterium]
MRLKAFGIVPESGLIPNVFKNLKDRLKYEPVLLYYRPTLFVEETHYTPNIMLLHPQIGIVLINVKNWNRQFLSRVFWDNHGRMVVNGKVYPNPLDEFRDIVRALTFLFRGKYNVSYFIYLPNVTKGEYETLLSFSSKVCEDRIFFKYDKDLKEKILKSAGAVRFTPAEEEDFNPLREKLFPYLKLENGGVLDLLQEEIIHNVGEGLRIVRGAAGTGKTAVLASKAKFEGIYKNREVVIFTFIRSLLQEFQRRLNGEIECYSIDPFIKRLEPRYNFANLEEIVEKLEIPEEDKYDVVICDEVQDFKAPYFKFIKKLVKPNGQLLFGVDETQRIYEWSNWTWKDVGINAKGRVTIFRKSYRNPSKIIEIGVRFLQKDPVLIKELKELEALDVNEVCSQREGGNLICVSDTLLAHFLKKHYKPNETFVLVPTPIELEKYAEILRKHRIKTTIFRGEVDLNKIEPDRYVLTTFRSAKGMERKNVAIVINGEVMNRMILTKRDERLWRKAIYVAITRAQENILIVGSGKFFDELMEIKIEMDEREVLRKR